MRLAFAIFKYFPYGGIQRDLLAIARACRSRGHSVRIYTLQWQGERPGDLEVIVAPVRAWTNHSRYRRFAAWVERHRARHPVDLLVGMNKMPGLDIYFAGDSCYLEKARTQRSIFYRMLPRYRLFAGFEAEVFGRHSDTEIMVLAKRQESAYRRCYATPEKRLHPMPPGIDRSRQASPERAAIRSAFRRELGLAGSQRLVLFLGSGFTTKGLDRALEGMAALPRDLGEATWMSVVGQDESRRFSAMARRLGIDERVRFYPGRDDVPRLLFGADLLVLPAYDENTGNVILEAMIAGLPVLATRNCGYAHYVETADAGRVLDEPYRQQDFDAALAAMLRDETARARWSRNGIAFGRSADIYSLHERAARFIVMHAEQRKAAARDAEDMRFDVAWRSRGRRVALREDVAAMIDGDAPFDRIMALTGEIYRDVGSRRTLRFELDGRGYFVKQHLGVGWGEIAKNLITAKRPVLDASNERIASDRLARAGVRTPSVAGFGRSGIDPARRRSFIITEELHEYRSLEDVCASWHDQPPAPHRKRALIAAVADLARRMHGAGVAHRDFYLCHLWLKRDALPQAPPKDPAHQSPHDTRAGTVPLALLDLHRARVRPIPHACPKGWVKRDLAALLFSVMELPLSRRDWLRFVAVYSGERPSRSLRGDGAFWRSVHRRACRLQRKARRKGIVAEPGARVPHAAG